jgi:integrase
METAVHKTKEQDRQDTVLRLLDTDRSERDALIAEYERRSVAAFAPTTRRNYLQIIAWFERWCGESGYDARPPVSPRTVAAYVDAMGGKIRATTIETRLWAINELHRSKFLPPPCQHRIVELALKAVKRAYGAGVRQAPPLGKREVMLAIENLGSSRLALRDAAVLWIASDSWCRSSEIVALKVRDIIRQEDGTSLLFIAKSKTDPYGEGAYAFLSRRGTEAALKWVETAGLNSDDPLLTKSQKNAKRAPLDPATISRIFKRCTGRPDVSAHSTRVGGVHDALRLGCDLSSIMIAGRWTSPEMPARYGRRLLASQSAAAKVSAAFSD